MQVRIFSFETLKCGSCETLFPVSGVRCPGSGVRCPSEADDHGTLGRLHGGQQLINMLNLAFQLVGQQLTNMLNFQCQLVDQQLTNMLDLVEQEEENSTCWSTIAQHVDFVVRVDQLLINLLTCD